MSPADFTIDFEGFRPQLKSFLLRITSNALEAEDLTQDAYVKAVDKLESFRGDSSIKTWVFAIAANLAKDLLREKKRWPEHVTDICKEAALSNQEFFQESMQIRMTEEQGDFEIKEHVALCFTCVSKSLILEQHIVLLLKEVYDFKVLEISEITNLTEAMVKYHLHQARSKMIKVFDHRCSLINKEGICHQCTELNGIYNPKQDAQAELAKLEMVKSAAAGDKEHLFDLRMQVLQGLDPF